jgi:hypothetical protein
MQGMISGNAVEKPVDMYQKSLLSTTGNIDRFFLLRSEQ